MGGRKGPRRQEENHMGANDSRVEPHQGGRRRDCRILRAVFRGHLAGRQSFRGHRSYAFQVCGGARAPGQRVVDCLECGTDRRLFRIHGCIGRHGIRHRPDPAAARGGLRSQTDRARGHDSAGRGRPGGCLPAPRVRKRGMEIFAHERNGQAMADYRRHRRAV